MAWLSSLFAIIQGIIDRLPSRKESLLNEIDKTEEEIKQLQKKNGKWTVLDSHRYYALTDRLQALRERSENASK